MTHASDIAWMEMAYGLAEKALGRTSPNPMVGAVIVKKGAVAGHGWHAEAGKPHAEIVAMERAGRRARGATLYLTLEPCVHWGRTPPCADKVSAAGFGRVVISSLDPNPIVHRKGVRALKRAGVPVEVGLLAERNARLNEAYAKFITRRVPFVTLKAALSLDGKMACRTGDSKWISAADTRDYVHLLRGECDALMIGANTLIADDPVLTVRHPNWGRKKIARVVLDSRLRFPLGAAMLGTLGSGRIIVFAEDGAPPEKAEALRAKGVEVVFVPRPLHDGGLAAVLEELGRREIASVLVEGGSRLITSFVRHGFADKIFLTVSPRLIGGREAPGLLGGPGIERMREALALAKLRAFRLDGDLILEGYF